MGRRHTLSTVVSVTCMYVKGSLRSGGILRYRWDILLNESAEFVGRRRSRLREWSLLSRVGLRLGLLRPGISALCSFLVTLFDKLVFSLLLDGVTSGSCYTLPAALHMIGGITHRVFLAWCVALLLFLILFLDDGLGLFGDKAGGFRFRLF